MEKPSGRQWNWPLSWRTKPGKFASAFCEAPLRPRRLFCWAAADERRKPGGNPPGFAEVSLAREGWVPVLDGTLLWSRDLEAALLTPPPVSGEAKLPGWQRFSEQSGNPPRGGWWPLVASERNKKSTSSTRWGWTPLSGWPCIRARSRRETTRSCAVDF